MKKLFYLLASIMIFMACKKSETEPLLQVKTNGLFSFTIMSEGDGQVGFKADSTQNIKEFTWDFGDGSTLITSTIGKITHTFTKNATFQVKLTAKNSNNQVSDTETVLINTRLARTFEDLPVSERSTIRVLHILTTLAGYNYENAKKELESPEFKEYTDKVFRDFVQRTIPNYPKEFDKLSFEHILYILPAEDTLKFYNGRDPDAFFRNCELHHLTQFMEM